MTILDDVQNAYNKYSLLPRVPYNIAKYLMNNDETIWRLINYNTADAWNELTNPNLTKSQKSDLIYKGSGALTDYKIFFDPGMDTSWNVQSTILRISPVTVIPKNYITGTQSIRFEVYTHAELTMLSNYNPRGLSIIQRIIEVLNGADIEGIGRIFFDYKASQYCRLMSINVGSPTYKGWDLIMCNQALG